MSEDARSEDRQIDPGVIEILGLAAAALSLGDHALQFVRARGRNARGRHRAIEKWLRRLQDGINDARAALQIIRAVLVDNVEPLAPDVIRFDLPGRNFPVFVRGFRDLLDAVREMTDALSELEQLSEGTPTDAERFYRISEAGEPALRDLRAAFSGQAGDLRLVLRAVDEFLATCAQELSDRSRWVVG
jgi:hypothetical protein